MKSSPTLFDVERERERESQRERAPLSREERGREEERESFIGERDIHIFKLSTVPFPILFNIFFPAQK